MKNTQLNNEQYLLRPSRQIFLWSEVSGSANEPYLQGEPNAVEKKYTKDKAEVSTEDPETAQGRNVIRGQAIMMLRKYPYETDSKVLHDAIAYSRRREMGIEKEGDPAATATEAARALKETLNQFRQNHTTPDKEGKVSFNAPSHINLELPYLTEIPDGRNFLRAEAMKRLKTVAETEDNKETRLALRAALEKSTKMETGQWYNEIDPDTKIKREAPAEKSAREEAKESSADELLKALNALPAPTPAAPT